jgi:hypothetical protein
MDMDIPMDMATDITMMIKRRRVVHFLKLKTDKVENFEG